MKNGILSIALGLLATATVQAAFTPIADASADYSATQGYKSWSYGYYTSEFNYSTFIQYDVAPNGTGWNAWSYSTSAAGGGFINGTDQFPGVNYSIGANIDAVRRWTSTVSDTIHISGILQKEWGGTQDWNNGVRCRILVNGNAILDQNLMPGTNGYSYPYTASAVVNVGDKVDFVVDAYGNNGNDRTTFTAMIVPEPGMLALLAVGGLVVLKRRRA
ncbi:MAG: PEP-CTERM sorting domain-containing protein [Lentisphaeria bacterium]